MGVNPDLLIIRKPGDLDTAGAFDAGDLLFAGSDNVLKRMSTSTFYPILNNVAKPISPSDPSPTVVGWYKPQISSELDKPTDPNSTADWGAIYANAGNLRAKSGYDTLFWFGGGTTWKKAEVKLPKLTVDTEFDPNNNTDAISAEAVNNYLFGIISPTLTWSDGTYDGSGNAIPYPGVRRTPKLTIDKPSIKLEGLSKFTVLKFFKDGAYITQATIDAGTTSYETPVNLTYINQYAIVITGVESTEKVIFQGEPIIKKPSFKKRVNVLDFGAKGDGVTNDTNAFNNAIAYLVAANGGVLEVPDTGNYYLANIVIPTISNTLMTIEIEGEYHSPFFFGTVPSTTINISQYGTRIKPYNNNLAVISSVSGGFYSIFNGVNLCISNLKIQCTDNPNSNGINAYNCAQLYIKNVVVTTNVYNPNASEPTVDSNGIVTPANNNAAYTKLENVLVTGFSRGIWVHEHTVGDTVIVCSCKHGLYFGASYQASWFNRYGSYRNQNGITIAGAHRFKIQQMNIEHAGPSQVDATTSWQLTQYDVNDPSNLGKGSLEYSVVVGDSGFNQADWKKNGGTNIVTTPI